MVGSSHQEEAIVSNIKHPSHTDPLRVGFFLGASVFFGVLIGLFVISPDIHIGLAFAKACISSAVVSFAFTRMASAYKMKKDAAYFEAKREEDRIRTEKAIAEMKQKEAHQQKG